MIERDIRAAASRSFDLAVVGGGIYGAMLALEAARRRLAVLLVERDDFGGGTSWNSLRIVHGGLRYLQTLDVRRYFESLAERRWWLRHFPDLVRPLPCLMPLYDRGAHRVALFRAAFALDRRLARGRDAGVRDDRRLPEGRVLSAAETARELPAVERRGLRGGALWHDAVMPDSQRLVMEVLRWAAACGATALNYVEARGLCVHEGRVAGVSVHDLVSETDVEIRAACVVNCAGPWSRDVAARFDADVPRLFPPSLALNLYLDRRLPCAAAVAVRPPEPGSRTYFLHPWKGGVLAGTYHAGWTGGIDAAEPGGDHLARFLAELAAALPALDLSSEHVLRAHWGFLPARRAGTARLAVREVLYDHGTAGGPQGLISVSGVKFTTARRVAERALAAVCRAAGRELPRPTLDASPEVRTVPAAAEIARTLVAEPEAVARLVGRIAAEESVVHLDDLLLRRTDWGIRPDDARALAGPIAGLLRWDPARRDAETRRVLGRSIWSSHPGRRAR